MSGSVGSLGASFSWILPTERCVLDQCQNSSMTEPKSPSRLPERSSQHHLGHRRVLAERRRTSTVEAAPDWACAVKGRTG